MNNIIVNFNPFMLEQSVLMYSDGNCIEEIHSPIDRVTDVVMGLKNKYNVDRIDLCGNSDYLSRFKAEMNLKFGNNNTQINIYSK